MPLVGGDDDRHRKALHNVYESRMKRAEWWKDQAEPRQKGETQ